MKKNFTLLLSAMLLVLTFQMQAQRALYTGLTDSSYVYQAPKTATPPVIDGNPESSVWDIAPWKSAMRISTAGDFADPRVEPAGPFAGVTDCEFNYKFIWDNDRYYMLMRWKDDNVVYADKHDGYGKMPVKPAYLTGITMPAAGAGDGTVFNAFRMDHISLMFTNYLEAFTTGVQSFSRANHSLWYNFFPAKVTHSTQPEAILWTQANNLPTGVTEIKNTRSACTYNANEQAYYIEFADTIWATCFATTNTKFLTTTGTITVPQKDFSVNPVAVGDKFMFSGEVNDADGTTNRRDYSLFISANTVNPNSSGKETVIIELVNQVTSGVKATSAKRNLEFYPNPNSTGTLRLNRIADVEIFNMTGQRILKSLNTSEVNISRLQPGVYMVKDTEGNVGKLIRK